jgi:hypothetical protein
LKNREISFDVDVSNLPCGLNGAIYLVEMPVDGGSAEHPSNKAGAAYGKTCVIYHISLSLLLLFTHFRYWLL